MVTWKQYWEKSGQLVSKIIIIILSCRVATSKNKNVNHPDKETCVIMSTQVIYKANHIFLLCGSTMLSAAKFSKCILFWPILKKTLQTQLDVQMIW